MQKAAQVSARTLCNLLHLPVTPLLPYREPVTATLSSDIASTLGLAAVGDEAYLEVTKVNPDGSVEVMSEMETEEPETEDGDMAVAKKAMGAVTAPPAEPMD